MSSRFPLALSQGNREVSQWNSFFFLQKLTAYSMRLGIVGHQEEPWSHCINVGEDNVAQEFHPNAQHQSGCCYVHTGLSTTYCQFSHVDDLAHSWKLSLASPDPFTSVARAHVESALIGYSTGCPWNNSPITVVYGKCQPGSMVQGSEQGVHNRTSSSKPTLKESVFYRLERNMEASRFTYATSVASRYRTTISVKCWCKPNAKLHQLRVSLQKNVSMYERKNSFPYHCRPSIAPGKVLLKFSCFWTVF